jgi:mannose PTS system EIIA component
MIGIVVVSHGRLADEFVAAAEHVLGPQNQLRAVAIGPSDDMEERRTDILDAVRTVDDGSGVVILTDMFGGTPSNLAISVIHQGRIEVIAGVNLPMLIKLAEVRERADLAEAARAAQDAGRHYIRIASVELAGGPA